MRETQDIAAGLMVLHGNRLEDLRDVLTGWLARTPLRPLEDECVLVQSNGIAQWLRLALARPAQQGGLGIAAAVQMALPGRFLWRAYRAVLGEEAVPAQSPFDKSRLVWRLMRLLPELASEPMFEPLAVFLGGADDARKRHQLAERLADLYDQYQVYRADWLEDWAAGRDQLRTAGGAARPLAAGDRWQAALWRRLLDDVGPDQAQSHRAAVHANFLAASAAAGERPPGLPRRIVVFGLSSLPRQTVEALSALSRWSQVVLVVMNPCRHYWADLIEDRELLRAEQRRHAAKPGVPALLAAEEMHLYAHPLLAAWGKQGRDYIRLLDEFDHPESYRHRFTAWEQRIDLFSEPDGTTLLGQVQAAILDLSPLPAQRQQLPPGDDSIAFHLAHSPQREVEILHDQLLARFEVAARAGRPIDPREVIVMVPDIEAYAPHIEAVFGRVPREDPRYIPYSIADRAERASEPMLVALDRLLGLNRSRLSVTELADLLDVPALRQRFGLAEDDLPLLHRWIEGAGIRWGLDGAQRASLGLPPVEQNTWLFGLRRMLLGYAVGEGEAWQAIEPYAEVGGLDASLLGPLSDLLERLETHWSSLSQPATPAVWGERLRALLYDFFAPSEAADRTRHERLLDGLDEWLQACAEAGFDGTLPVEVVREAWLAPLDGGSLSKRFLAGAVSFGTLMPMRAIPFRLVCLLGMNDGDYPRARPPMDFDLMARPAAWRPGDRSRREDDRYLFLEALLSARDALHVSWVGRSVRDNSVRAPSVLVGQLRDYLAAGWQVDGQGDPLPALTIEHPLQPFSRLYLQGGKRLFTYASEWERVHQPAPPLATGELAAWPVERPIGLAVLRDFLRRPVRAFFQARLGVRFELPALGAEALEPFALDPLDRFGMTATLLDAALRSGHDAQRAIAQAMDRLQRSGALPLAGFAQPVRQELQHQALRIHQRLQQELDAWPQQLAKQELRLSGQGVVIEDWLVGLRAAADGRPGLLLPSPTTVLDQRGGVRGHRLLPAWTDHLVAQAAGLALETRYVGPDATVVLPPLPRATADEALARLLGAWREGMARALPMAAKTALAYLAAGTADPLQAARQAYASADGRIGEQLEDPYLARAFADFDALLAAGFVDYLQPYADMLGALRVEPAR